MNYNLPSTLSQLFYLYLFTILHRDFVICLLSALLWFNMHV